MKERLYFCDVLNKLNMIIVIEITDREVSAAIAELNAYLLPFGGNATSDQLATLLSTYPWLISGLSDGGFDTMEREYIINYYLSDILGIAEEWPIYADSDDDTHRFFAKLTTRINEITDQENI